MKKSESITNLMLALGKAQASMGKVLKKSNNPFFGSSYADLRAICDAAEKPMQDNALVLTQFPYSTDSGVGVVNLLLHTGSGEWLEQEVYLPFGKKADPQTAGSCITYTRRYSVAAIFQVITVDDDAEHAMGRKNGKPLDKPKPKAKHEVKLPTTGPVADTVKEINAAQSIDELVEIWTPLSKDVQKQVEDVKNTRKIYIEAMPK